MRGTSCCEYPPGDKQRSPVELDIISTSIIDIAENSEIAVSLS